MMKSSKPFVFLLLVAISLAATAGAEIAPATSQSATQAAPAVRTAQETTIWPDLSGPTLCWLGAVLILALTIRPKPLLWIRNLDALVLAAMCILLALRDAPGAPAPGGHTWPWYAHVGLTVALLYWLLRGVANLAARKPIRHPGTVSGGVRLVLVLLGFALCGQYIATAPLTPGSRDSLVGGLFTAATGKLPYGDAPAYEHRSPLLYLVHAGAVRVIEPTFPTPDGAVGSAMTWGNRVLWQNTRWAEDGDLAPARLVNAALFVLTLFGLFLIGRRLQTEGSAWMMVAIFCLFPGTRECLACPEIMLPLALLTWGVMFALWGGLGGLLSMLCIVFAGLAWPWAWLAVPILLAYFWRRGWQWFWSTAGLLGAAALCVCGAMELVQPAIPRAAGVLRLAGVEPSFTATLAGPNTVIIERRTPNPEAAQRSAVTGYFWRSLLARDSLDFGKAARPGDDLKLDWPNGVDPQTVLYQQVEPDAPALPLLQNTYRQAVRELPESARFLAALRTALESTWPLAGRPASASTWDVLAGTPDHLARWVLVRRVVKAMIGLLVIWATLAIFFGRRTRPRHLLGALLLSASGGLLASESGAAAGHVWLMPMLAALWALYEPEAAPPRPSPAPVRAAASGLAPIALAPAPRISVEATPPNPPSN